MGRMAGTVGPAMGRRTAAGFLSAGAGGRAATGAFLAPEAKTTAARLLGRERVDAHMPHSWALSSVLLKVQEGHSHASVGILGGDRREEGGSGCVFFVLWLDLFYVQQCHEDAPKFTF
jgi:hypothetical protein